MFNVFAVLHGALTARKRLTGLQPVNKQNSMLKWSNKMVRHEISLRCLLKYTLYLLVER